VGMRERVFWCHSVSVTRVAFQACLIDRSSISPFRINSLRAAETVYRKTLLQTLRFAIRCAVSELRAGSNGAVAELCKTSNVLGSLTPFAPVGVCR
jgi:hypothetical protein